MNAQTKIEAELACDPRPKSAVSGGVGFVGLAGLLGWAAIARGFGMDGPFAGLAALFACGVPMILWSIFVDKVHLSPTTGIDWASPPRPIRETLDVSIAKITGLWATWAAIACVYCIGRWYWDGNYLFAMYVLGVASIPMLALSVPYVLWLDRRLKQPRDGAWHFGQLIAGRSDRVDREMLYEHLRQWAVKGFFLAFMIAIVPGNWVEAIRPATAEILADPARLVRWVIAAMFMVDATFATVGYVLTLKPLDAHIRSANPYAAGWTAALICYPPFVLIDGPLNYYPGGAGDNAWAYWLEAHPVALALTGCAIVVLTGIYTWATVAFGLRFSNLTHRGILTHGPYAWTKHPAYLTKNLFWWIAAMPFLAVSNNPVDMIRNTALLATVSGIYYWRARTEERHLGADPAYREYAEWMERNGPIPKLVRRLRSRGPQLIAAD